MFFGAWGSRVYIMRLEVFVDILVLFFFRNLKLLLYSSHPPSKFTDNIFHVQCCKLKKIFVWCTKLLTNEIRKAYGLERGVRQLKNFFIFFWKIFLENFLYGLYVRPPPIATPPFLKRYVGIPVL